MSEEHAELRATVRRFLQNRCPEAAVRRAIDSDSGYDAQLWSQMAGQLGLHGLGLPEAYGGSGYGPQETTIVFEELGRALVPSPFFATVALAAGLLVALGDQDANQRYLPAIAGGEFIATVAAAEGAASWQPQDLSDVVAEHRDGQWRLSGEKTTVLAADAAGLILVVVTAGTQTSVYAVDPGAPGVTVVALSPLDLTRRQSKVRFDNAPATLVGEHGGAGPAVAAMLDSASVALAAEQAGAAGYLLQMCMDYAKLRHQFGRPIGAFQAIQHMAADMTIGVDGAQLLVREAISRLAKGQPAGVEVSQAKAFANEKCLQAARMAQQIHGGIGFIAEFDQQLWYRRVAAWSLRCGTAPEHRARVAEALLDRPGIVRLGYDLSVDEAPQDVPARLLGAA
ncbi:acyl-CoA dehydrogenase family protein [uncultured Mycobacterium sp.]|uniref:acyl-CoA dehydrogenase family protein n=1 Tax=uncultured Mycobacterium sp. TaxID=171292 RepID=UPI0035CAECF8